MIRGTTPTLIFTISSSIDFSAISEAEIYCKTISKLITKTKDEMSINATAKTISVTLTQEETLALCIGECMVQLRVLMSDGTAMATKAQTVRIDQILKAEVIE